MCLSDFQKIQPSGQSFCEVLLLYCGGQNYPEGYDGYVRQKYKHLIL